MDQAQVESDTDVGSVTLSYQVLLSAAQAIACGEDCKRPLAAALSQKIAKNALRFIGKDWVGFDVARLGPEQPVVFHAEDPAFFEHSGDRTDSPTSA